MWKQEGGRIIMFQVKLTWIFFINMFGEYNSFINMFGQYNAAFHHLSASPCHSSGSFARYINL